MKIRSFSIPPATLAAFSILFLALAGSQTVVAQAVTITGTNYALNAPCYMVRLHDDLPPATNANDGNLATVMETTDKTVDGYWETDLGQVRALHHVRVIGLDGTLEQYRLGRATLRLFDASHETVHVQELEGTSSTFDLVLPGPVLARYVRVGYENKRRSSPTNDIEWFLRIREVEAYGQPSNQVGILSFTATPTSSTAAGQPVKLAWQTKGVQEWEIHPGIGSVAAQTGTSGAGQITVNPTASTRYILVGKTPTAEFVRHLSVTVAGQAMPPQISEIVASNRLSLRDGFKNAPDWIEIHNPNASALNIAGYCLSDDPAARTKWTFPAGTSIPAHGYLIVCASGTPSSTPDAAGYLHAGFSLAVGGESVVLSSPGGATVLDSITFPAQDEDLAYGRKPDGTLAFLEPTPGQPNLAASFAGWLQPPVFSQTRGVRTDAFSLTLTNPNADGGLFYSTDGSEPSVPYTGPIAVGSSLSVRATVRRDGWHSPRVVTHSYLFPAQAPAASVMNQGYAGGDYLSRQLQGFQDLPLVALSLPNLPDDYVEIEGSAEFFLPGSTTPIQVNCGVERFGGSWTEFAKKGYKLEFNDKYGARKLEAPLFNGFDRGMPVKEVFDSLELRSGNHDLVDRGFFMSSRFIEDTTNEMGSLNPHGRYVHMFVNGTYWGMYDMRERMLDAFLAEYLGGAKEDYVNVRGNDNIGDNFIPGTPEPPNRALWENVRSNRGSYAAIKDKLDMSHLIDFMLIWYFGNNESEYRCAGPIAPGSGFKFWLADPDGYLYSPDVYGALSTDRSDNPGPGGIFGALVTEAHPDFMTLLADRIQKHFFTGGALTPERNLARLNARMDEIRNAMVSECARWGYRSPENWAEAAESIRNVLFPQRTDVLFNQLRSRGLFPTVDAPVLAQHGGTVNEGFQLTFGPINGTVYFTLDGSDPRLPGGAVSPAALSWTGTATTLIAQGSSWKYWDRGSLPAANWAATSYSDAAWTGGTAPFGYGDTGIATTVSFGPNSNTKYPTTYFRKTITVANPAVFSELNLGVQRDDGVIVYINGTEVARSNMPAGAAGYTTFAVDPVGGDDETTFHTFSIPAGTLQAGANVVAVELHQSVANSSDLRFDLSLTGSASGVAATLNGNTRVRARVLSGSTWSALADATFRVAFPLVANGPYTLDSWSASAAAGTYPPNMTFLQTSATVPDPALVVAMDSPWVLPYNRTSKSRVNGLGANGFSFINTDNPQPETGSGYMGAALLTLDTTGAQNIRVTWTGGTVTPNTCDYGIRLQYRVGESAAFTDVTANGNPVEYLKNATAGHSALVGPVTLPAVADNQPLVQLRWKYYHRGGTGSRPQLRVDDIQISAGNPAPYRAVLASAPVSGQTGRALSPITVQVRAANGALATGYNGQVQLSVLGATPLAGTTSRTATNGTVVFNDIILNTPGAFTFTASATSLLTGEADTNTRVVGFADNIVPLYIQGNAPVNTTRIPWAARFTLTGLRANATYRYANRMRIAADPATSNGAGNMIFSAAGLPFTRSLLEPSFLPGALNSGHGQFTTNAEGAFSGWFITEPTGNERFTPGNTLFPLLLLNDGEGGTGTFHNLVSGDTVQVMAFGGATNQGMPVNGVTSTTAGAFAVLRAGADTAARPVAAIPIEATGAVYDTTYAGYYRLLVAGKAGCWGTMLPVSLADAARPFDLRNAAGTLISSHVLPARPAFIRSGNTISMTSTPGATIRYTTNGADPAATSTAYSAATPPVLDAGVWTVKAKAYFNGTAGVARAAIYTILPAAPVFSRTGDIISMTTTTAAAAIRYTTNGTEPTATSTLYNATTKLPLASGKWTIKAKAFKNGQASTTTSAAYTVYLPLITMNAVRSAATDALGRRMISYSTALGRFTRVTQEREIYLRLDLPVAQSMEGGMAVYHGLEAVRDVVQPGDLLYLKFGGEAPYSGMTASSWTPVSFAAIINRVLGGGTYYFKLVLAGTSTLQPTDPATLGVTLRYHVARFVNQVGAAIASLDTAKPLWMVFHGKGEGELRMRALAAAFATTPELPQVAIVDWAKCAGTDGAGRFFINLGVNVNSLLKTKGVTKAKANLAGHSWGAQVGFETAYLFGGVNRFIVLDPELNGGGGYSDNRANFVGQTLGGVQVAISVMSTGIKGGPSTGTWGNDAKTGLCHYSLRLLSSSHIGSPVTAAFHNNLSKDWLRRSLTLTTPAYWPFFKGLGLTSQTIPWAGIDMGSGIDVECHGVTTFTDNTPPLSDVVTFQGTSFLLFKAADGRLTEARATTATNGTVTWTYMAR